MNRYKQSPDIVVVSATLMYLLASSAHASSAGIEIVIISVIFYVGILPAFLIGIAFALRKKGTFLLSLSLSIFITLIILIAWALFAWWKNQNAGFLHQLEWPFKLLPFTIVPAIVANTITYWMVYGVKYRIKRRANS